MAASFSPCMFICFLRSLIALTFVSTTPAEGAHWSKHHLLKDTWLHRTARVSQKVLIPCDLPTTVTVHWRYSPGEHSEVEHLTANGLVVDNRKDRFQLEPNGLLITDVQRSDAGWYICREGHGRHGRKRIVRLSIPWQSVHTYLGESTVLECRSAFSHSVLWRYSEPHSESSQILYWGRIYGKDPRRFEVLSSNSATRTFDLSIRNVTFSDAGIYRCTENSGKYPGEVRFRLTVRGELRRTRELAHDSNNNSTSSVHESNFHSTTSQPHRQLSPASDYYQGTNADVLTRQTNIFLCIVTQTVIFVYIKCYLFLRPVQAPGL